MRTATIKSLDHEIELAYLTKEDFNKSLKAIEEEVMDYEVDFLRNLHSWQNMPKKKVIKYVKMCEHKKFTYGETVYKEGDPNNFVYIVKNGEFELVKKLPRQKNPRNRRYNGKSMDLSD